MKEGANMTLIELNDWQDECYQTTRVRAYTRDGYTGDDAEILERYYSKQFDTFDLVSDISYHAGVNCDEGNYVYKITLEGIDRV
jgi:hypothetical protein